MKKSLFIIVNFLMIVCNYAQTIQIGIGGGSTIVTGKEFYTKEFNNGFLYEDRFELNAVDGLNFNSEYNLNLKARLFFPNNPFIIYSEVSYNSLIGEGMVRKVYSDPPMPYIPPLQKSESKSNLVNVSLGIEYEFFNKSITPFLSSGIVLSYLGDINVETMDNNYEGKIMEGGIRYGFEIGLGVYYNFYDNFLIGISSQYSMNNLIGKKEAEENINTVKTNINILYEL
ncbi:MAG: hypothetical protein KKD86_06415 [Bacteroidetes bacterium]|nr:hypothetical protein [Bacteroidota bacterium]MBU1678477.1 hypothetical protein [Bacteroidota bacterium]